MAGRMGQPRAAAMKMVGGKRKAKGGDGRAPLAGQTSGADGS
jgi:hypothetical protein